MPANPSERKSITRFLYRCLCFVVTSFTSSFTPSPELHLLIATKGEGIDC